MKNNEVSGPIEAVPARSAVRSSSATGVHRWQEVARVMAGKNAGRAGRNRYPPPRKSGALALDLPASQKPTGEVMARPR